MTSRKPNPRRAAAVVPAPPAAPQARPGAPVTGQACPPGPPLLPPACGGSGPSSPAREMTAGAVRADGGVSLAGSRAHAAIAAAMSEDKGPDSLDAHVRKLMKDLGLTGFHVEKSLDVEKNRKNVSVKGWPDCRARQSAGADESSLAGCSAAHSAYEMSTALGSSLRVTMVGSPRKCAASMRRPRSSRNSLVPMRTMSSMSRVYLSPIMYTLYMGNTRETEAKMAEAPTLFDATPDRAVMRRCSACGESKPLATAYRKRRGGYRKECRTCQYAREKEWREAQGPQYRRATTQWELYRLSWDDYLEMLEKQGGVCALCRKPFSDNLRLIHTDHKHGCEHLGKGKKSCRECVRGILCHRCNIFVGWIETDYRSLGDLFNYLGVDGVVMWAHIMRDIGYELIVAGEAEYAARGGGRDA